MIKIENFTKNFGKNVAVKDLSFEVNKGEIMAFLGANGSGKTTTIRCLLNIYIPTNGVLTINGSKYNSKMSNILGYLPEERGIYTKANVIDLLYYFGELRGIKKAEVKKFITEYLNRVDLADSAHKKVSELSSGMQQKVQIAIAVMHKPEVLILDEPYKGLDAVNRQMFTDYFREMNQKEGTTILYSTHIVDEAQAFANNVTIIKDGKRAEYGSISDVRQKYGTDSIRISFKNKLEVTNESKKLFNARISNKTAELMLQKNVNPEDVLNYLIKNEVGLISYNLDYPSLNQIFIDLQKK